MGSCWATNSWATNSWATGTWGPSDTAFFIIRRQRMAAYAKRHRGL